MFPVLIRLIRLILAAATAFPELISPAKRENQPHFILGYFHLKVPQRSTGFTVMHSLSSRSPKVRQLCKRKRSARLCVRNPKFVPFCPSSLLMSCLALCESLDLFKLIFRICRLEAPVLVIAKIKSKREREALRMLSRISMSTSKKENSSSDSSCSHFLWLVKGRQQRPGVLNK